MPDGTCQRMFVHVRNKYYRQRGAQVTVLNFAAEADYELDGILVISLGSFQRSREQYDLVLAHSANLRNHYLFLKRYHRQFPRLVFFFHGHEVLDRAKDYPPYYEYMPQSHPARKLLQKGYDRLKFALWRRYYRQLAEKSHYVFVSEWMEQCFRRNIGLTREDLHQRCCMIHNSVGAVFQQEQYDWQAEKAYDFITIRANLDNSVYALDDLMILARRYPHRRFLVIGKGDFFRHYECPDNVEWLPENLKHQEMVAYLNRAACGLMLTRFDTQGVMTCEMAALGMPVITSDIPVCHEIFGDMPNVKLVANCPEEIDLEQAFCQLLEGGPYPKNERYFADKTLELEWQMFREILKME